MRRTLTHSAWSKGTKKRLAFLISFVLLFSALMTSAIPAATPSGTQTITATFGATKYIVNGKLLAAQSLVYNNVAYYPAAYFAHALGCTTNWDAATNVTTVATGGTPVIDPIPNPTFPDGSTKKITVTFGATKYMVDYEPLTEQSLLYNNVVYYPAAYFAHALGCTTSWDAATNITTVTPENADVWAKSVFDEAIQKLVDEGAMKIKQGYCFQYTYSSGKYAPFVTDEAISQYANTPAVVGGKIIFGQLYMSGNLSVYKTPGQVPYYQTGIFTNDYPTRFADCIDECATLIIYGGFESSRYPKYYSGGIDRVDTTTLVFVIDAKARKILHVETVGTDSPGAMTDHTTGYTLADLAIKYVNGLYK